MNIFFGTDGWRGLIDSEINFDSVAIVAQAFSDYCKSNYDNPSVAVGYDGRKYSKEFSEIFSEVLSGNQITVYLSRETIPTPVLSFTVKHHCLSAGVMITASHNPPQYNGIKFKANYGGPFFTEETQKVENLLYKSTVQKNDNKIERLSFMQAYLQHVQSLIDFGIIKSSGIKILIDSMGGVGKNILQDILKKHGITADLIYGKTDENFFGRSAEPIAKNLLPLSNEIINKNLYSIGLATDGDADRIGVVCNDGNFLSAQETILLITDYLLNAKKIEGNIVKTSSVTNKLKTFFENSQRKVFDVQVGFKYICEKMISEDIAFGCEESGGFGYKNHIPERDGILSGLILCELLAASGFTKLSDLLESKRNEFGKVYYDRIDYEYPKPNRTQILPAVFSNPPQKIIGLVVNDILSFKSSRGIINGLKFNLANNTRWLLIRASETEPIVRIYAEGNNKDEVTKLIEYGKKLILDF
jgi:phosphomannomutase